MTPSKGKIVLYTHTVDDDPSYSPNVSPAIITHVYPEGDVSLACHGKSGTFYLKHIKVAESATRGFYNWPQPE